MNKEVFISYKSEEFEEANWVKDVLETNGISCWMAPMCITGGSSYAKEIPQAIRNCKVFVLILSEKSQMSKWVPREVDQAINEGKIVMPFMLENCQLKDDFNFYLTNVQRYAAYESKAAAIQKMLREIKAIIGPKQTPPVQPQPQPQSQPRPVQPQPQPQPRPAQPQSQTKSVKPAKKQKKKGNKKLIMIASLAGVACLILFIILLSAFNKVTIAGEKFKRNSPYVTLYDKKLTAEDMDVIGKMKKVTTISLENCTIEGSIYMLCKEDLISLELRNCNLTDNQMEGMFFSLMPNLRILDVSGNIITKLNEIEELSKTLTDLSISNTLIHDLEFLGTFSGLRYLHADNLGLTSLEPIKYNTELTTLSVNGNELTSLKGIENCLKLTNLYAGYNQLTSLDEMANATQLREVYFNHNQISDFSLLSKSAAELATVYVDDNQISDIEFLSDCTGLQYFGADNNQISDISILGKNPGLKDVSVENNKLTTLNGLEYCKEIKYLDVSGNQISDVNALGSIILQATYGCTLDLSNNKITNLVLPTNAELDLLNLRGNAITNLNALANAEVNNLVLEYNDAIDFKSLASYKVHYKYMIMNCPADKQVNLSDTLGYKTAFTTEEELLEKTSNYYSVREKTIYEPKLNLDI